MKTHPLTKHPFDLFPANLLVQRRRWQGLTHTLPKNGCLLILQKANAFQAQLVQRLGRAFQAQGRHVFVLNVD
jgi:hypothetical protein